METAASTARTTTFEVGETYRATSACDHSCVWSFEVVKRTARFVTLKEDDGTIRRVGVRSHDGHEYASPFGTYSMAPVIASGR